MTQTERNRSLSQFAAGDAMDDTSWFNILVVEDDRHIASFIAQRLEGDGHTTTVVTNGASATDSAGSAD